MDELIDTHHHLWALADGADYPWLRPGAPLSHNGNVDALRRDYLPDDYRADMASVRLVGSVHVEAGRSAAQALDETRWVQRLIDTHGLPSAIVANVDLWSDDFADQLARHREASALRAIRVRVSQPGQTLADLDAAALRLDDAAWERALPLLVAGGLGLELQVTPAMAEAAATLARRYPEARVAITHTGFPFDRTAAGMTRWWDGLRLLGQAPNTYLKISGIGMTDHHWQPVALAGVVRAALAAFPLERVMLGSNLPVDRLYASPRRLLDTMLGALSGLDAARRKQVLVETARSFYRLGEE